MTTRELESAIFRALTKMGTYLCFEVMMPRESRGIRPNERVDLLSFNTSDEWKFYELKVTKADFYSKCKHTFYGHLNYFVMPHDLYKQVKDDIPAHVGVYTAREYGKGWLCKCEKKAKRQELGIDEERLKFAFMQALSREHEKYRRLLNYTEGKGEK